MLTDVNEMRRRKFKLFTVRSFVIYVGPLGLLGRGNVAGYNGMSM
jgi:hypothetical protein